MCTPPPRLSLSLSRLQTAAVSLAVSLPVSLPLFLAMAASGCIKRTAPPPASASSGPFAAAAAEGGRQPSPAAEAANARIAGIPRVDLLGGLGTKAFKVSGEA